ATALGRTVANGSTPPPDPDLQADMYALACDVLGAAGYRHYEVSNWALPGSECEHNLGYWRGRPYLGLGAGAHSARDGRRWWNLRPPQQYVQAVVSGASPVGGGEVLSADDLRLERLLLGLRTAEGITGSEVDAARAAPFLAEGLLDDRGGMLVPTERGLFLANEVVLALAG